MRNCIKRGAAWAHKTYPWSGESELPGAVGRLMRRLEGVAAIFGAASSGFKKEAARLIQGEARPDLGQRWHACLASCA